MSELAIKDLFSYFCITKVEVDGFSMPNVKNAIWFRRKTGTDLKKKKRIKCNRYDHTYFTTAIK